MATASRLSVQDFNTPGVGNPHLHSSYVSARVLAAGAAENITIPVGAAGQGIATIVRIAANADIYINFGGAAAVPAADIDDGTASELIKANSDPEWRYIPAGSTVISVVSAGTAIVTASFFIQ